MSALRIRVPLPQSVVTVAVPDKMREGIGRALRDHVAVTHAASLLECTDVLAKVMGVSVLLRVPSVHEAALGTRLLSLRQLFPNTSCVALFDVATSDSRWALQFGLFGESCG